MQLSRELWDVDGHSSNGGGGDDGGGGDGVVVFSPFLFVIPMEKFQVLRFFSSLTLLLIYFLFLFSLFLFFFFFLKKNEADLETDPSIGFTLLCFVISVVWSLIFLEKNEGFFFFFFF